jgi:ABC-type glycerol-3-phosphate transport system permease component
MVLPLASLGMPIFEQALSWGYLDNQFGLSVVYGVLFSAWASFFMASYFSSLPDDLIEAAHIDGATKLDVFVRIAVPLAFPAIASTLVINLFVMWSELIIAIMFLPSAELQTVAATLAQFNEQRRSGGPVLAAAMLLDVLPVIIAFALAQRWLKAEVFGGGVKS